MASQEEDNKLECISNVNREQEIYCLNVYKKYDTILNNKSESFETKVKSVIEVWQSIADLNLAEFDIRYVIQIIEWAKLHALNIVLTGEWKSTKEHYCKSLLENIEQAQNKLLNVNNAFSTRCQKLADVVKKPWEDPVLTNMLHTKEAEIGAPEIEFFCVETAYLVSVRLKKLCESQCEDLALNLVTNFLNYTKLATTHNFNINATATQMWFIFDIYMALLYKFQDKHKMVQNFQELQLHEGLQLVKRFAKKRVKISKIWRNCHKIAIYGSRFFLSKALMKYTDDLKEFLIDLLKTYISLSSTDTLLSEFVTSVRNITNLADAPGLCVMCEVIHREAGDKLRHFIIEMYIRALTTDMNELERLKHMQDTDKATNTTSRLANTFSNLADLLDDHVKVSRECVLTAFSLEPTKERLKRIEELAGRSGFQVLDTGQEWKCRLHPPMLPSDDIAWMCAECGDWMNKPELSAPVKINMALNEALQGSVLGISDSLCDDLVVCLSNPRYQVLSWLLPWGDLYRLCVMYLSDPEKTKNFVTELKFVDIDYSLFQHIKREPLDEYTGIEKGYEQYLDLDFVSNEENGSISEDSMSQDKSLSLGSDGSGEPYLTPFPQPKSDPNTLKSLRMFRPNLKRKTAESESVPEKQIKTNADINIPSSSATSGLLYNHTNPSSLCNYLSSNKSSLPNRTLPVHTGNTTITKEETDSKNVVAATLLQLGGQVAINNKTIQEPQSQIFRQIPNSHFQEQKTTNLDLVRLLHNNTLFNHPIEKQTEPNSPKATVNNYFSDNVDRLLSTAQLLEELTDRCKEMPQDHLPKESLPVNKSSHQSMRNTCRNANNEPQRQHRKSFQLPTEVTTNFTPIQLPRLLEVTAQASSCQDPTRENQEGQLLEMSESKSIFIKRDLQRITTPLIPTLNSLCPEQMKKNQEVQLVEPSEARNIEFTQNPKMVLDVLPKDFSNQYEDISSASECSNQVDNNGERCKVRPNSFFKYREAFSESSSDSLSATFDVVAVRGVLNEVENNNTILDHTTDNIKTIIHCAASDCIIKVPEITKAIYSLAFDNIKRISDIEQQNTHWDCSRNSREKVFSADSELERNLDANQSRDVENSSENSRHLSKVVSFSDPEFDGDLEVNQSNSLEPNENTKNNGEGIIPTVKNGDIEAAHAKNMFNSEAVEVPGSSVNIEENDVEVTRQNSSQCLADSEDIKPPFIAETDVSKCSEDMKLSGYVVTDEHNYFKNVDSFVKNDIKVPVDCERFLPNDVQEFTSCLTVDDMSNITYLENLDDMTSVESDVLDLAMENSINIINADDLLVNCENYETVVDIVHEEDCLLQRAEEHKIFSDDYANVEEYSKQLNNFVKCEAGDCFTKPLPYDELLPKNINLTENIRKYYNTHTIRYLNVPCFKNDYDLSLKNNVNNNDKLCTICKGKHSSMKTNNFSLKELKVLLRRLPTNVACMTICSKDRKVKNAFTKNKQNIFERMKSPTRKRRKKRRDKPDIYNYFKRPIRKLRYRRVSPLLDINLCQSTRKRIPRKRLFNSKFRNKKVKINPSGIELLTVDANECKKVLEKLVGSYPLVEMEQRNKERKVTLENIISKNNNRLPLDDKLYAKQILKNVPGLNDYEMLRPRNVNHIVNVVQISSGGRPTSNVTSQNSQTSTQVSPHIQRIGQPRVAEPKPETAVNVDTSGTTISSSTTCTVTKPVATPPSTLINILSQQIIRPNPNTVRNRTTPLINILSQQILKPGSSAANQKVSSNCVPTTTNVAVSSTENVQNVSIKLEPTFAIKSEPTFTIKADPPYTLKSDTTSESSKEAEVIPVSEPPKILNPTIKTLTTPTATASNPAGTILQFICKKTLPKFQQAFGKTVYQPSSDTPNQASTNLVETSSTTDSTSETKKSVQPKTAPVNLQPLQGNVIYRGQMPVGQTISLIPPGSTTRQLFRITGSTHEQISLVKETVIQNKMSALLAAALQGKPKVSEQNGEVVEEYSATRITLCRPNATQNTRLVKPVQLQIPANVIRTSPQPNLSSTTLEQLREFDMVYKQVKERSSSSIQPEVATKNVQPQSENQESPQQRISFTYVNQVQKYTQLSPVVVVSSYSNLQPAASPALSVTSQGSSSPCVTPASTPTLPKMASKTSKGKSLKTATATTAINAIKSAAVPNIPKPQQKPQEDEHTTQRIFDILAEYAEQLRNSPDLNNKPAPRRRSNPPTNPSSNSKRKKSSSSKKSGQSNSSLDFDTEDLTMESEDSSGGNIVQLSVTDDEQSQATSITPPESNSQNSPGPRQVILTDGNNPTSQNVIITESSVGEALKNMPNTALIVPGSYIMPVSMVKGTQQIAVVSGGSKILATVPARSGQNMLLFQSFLNQNKKSAISAVKYSAIQPISGGISSQSLAGISAQPPVILPSNSVAIGQPITLKKFDNADRLNTELLLTISRPRETVVKIEDSPETPQPDSSTSLSNDSIDIKEENTSHSDSSSNEKTFSAYQKTNSVATSVIASCIKEVTDDNASINIINASDNTSVNKGGEQNKAGERMQSVLVNASNGPMLSHTTPRFRKQNEPASTTTAPNKEQFLHNGEKKNPTEQKSYKNTTHYYVGRNKKNPANTNKKIDSELQKQAVIERELRLQKSLSEECEDLGVDEPSTSDLFPEADLLFDSNHSPSYDQSSQDGKRPLLQHPEMKEAKTAMNLFSDDENSASLRTDIFDYVSSEYHAVESALNYQARQLMNGNNTSNESASSCEDSTLLPNCGTMSEVTLNSPISPAETYNSDSTLSKYKYKYSNRKKGERNKLCDQTPVVEVSSSEAAAKKVPCHISYEESDKSVKVVRVAISKTDLKEAVKCQLHCDEDSKRGARKSAKKPCSCCSGPNGAGVSNMRKRPQITRPQTPLALQHKKTFFNKKR